MHGVSGRRETPPIAERRKIRPLPRHVDVGSRARRCGDAVDRAPVLAMSDRDQKEMPPAVTSELASTLLDAVGKDAASVAQDYAEVAIDLLAKSDVVDKIPVIGTAVNLFKAGTEIASWLFAKKLIGFLYGAKVDESAKQGFRLKYAANEKGRRRIGESPLLLLDRVDDMRKARPSALCSPRFSPRKSRKRSCCSSRGRSIVSTSRTSRHSKRYGLWGTYYLKFCGGLAPPESFQVQTRADGAREDLVGEQRV